jgi:DNA-binding response OmpR family regulator
MRLEPLQFAQVTEPVGSKLELVQRKIVVVEDETTIAQAIAARLAREGFLVEIAADGPSGVEVCRRVDPDLVVLDIMLPALDGLEVCRRIQAEQHVPVLMLTARDTETDMLVGLGVGADDYMTKPFSVRELVARINAILRRVERSRSTAPETIRFGTVEIDAGTRRVRKDGRLIHLTPIEFDLLHRLARRPGIVFSREQLLQDVWGYQDGSGARTVDSHIAAIRRKLGPNLLRTVHGVGYAFEVSEDQ